MKKVVFLDRDGVVIMERGEYNYLPEHVIMVDGIVEALLKLKKKGIDVIIISNQGGIGKGLCSLSDVKKVNNLILQFFKTYGIELLDIMFCPHHPEQSACICRKPDSLMIEKMIHRYKINPSISWMIGDQPRDAEAGIKAGLNTLLIEPNSDLNLQLDRILE